MDTCSIVIFIPYCASFRDSGPAVKVRYALILTSPSSRPSSIATATRLRTRRPKGRDSIPCSGKSSGTHPNSHQMGLLPRGPRWQGREADHSHPSSAEVKNGGAILPLPAHLHSVETQRCTVQCSAERSHNGDALHCQTVGHTPLVSSMKMTDRPLAAQCRSQQLWSVISTHCDVSSNNLLQCVFPEFLFTVPIEKCYFPSAIEMLVNKRQREAR
jgi:hypothetical protein